MKTDSIRFPIGEFKEPTETELKPEFLVAPKADIASFPSRVKNALQSLDEKQLDTPYRPNGWTVRQVVAHCADSHSIFLFRVKIALTQDDPTVHGYPQGDFANLMDSISLPVTPALNILHAVHERLSLLFQNLDESQLKRTFFHAEYKVSFSIARSILLYAWHGNHHLAQIVALKNRENWL